MLPFDWQNLFTQLKQAVADSDSWPDKAAQVREFAGYNDATEQLDTFLSWFD